MIKKYLWAGVLAGVLTALAVAAHRLELTFWEALAKSDEGRSRDFARELPGQARLEIGGRLRETNDFRAIRELYDALAELRAIGVKDPAADEAPVTITLVRYDGTKLAFRLAGEELHYGGKAYALSGTGRLFAWIAGLAHD